MSTLQKSKTAGLYIHIPFCEKRCNYCDFYTVAHKKDAIPRYVAAVKNELKLYSQQKLWSNQEFSTLYFGGGTPSLLSVEQLAGIIQTAQRYFSFREDSEITMEANPGTTTQDALAGYRKGGANRLSLGVQSFQPEELVQLDRLHSVEDVERNVIMARDVGFANISIDLIFALPGQRPHVWRDNMEKAIALNPEHISAYNLTFEPGTPLFQQLLSKKVRKTTEARERILYNFTIDFLEDHGYSHYEVSNYAKPGFESQHNSKYWDGSLYLAIGASAHGYVGTRRWWNKANWLHYCELLEKNKLPIDGFEELNRGQQMFERIMLGLRQETGVALNEFESEFGVSFHEIYRKPLASLQKSPKPLIDFENNIMRLTREGWLLCDAVCAEFA